jgi:hypothetical protein
MVRGKRRVSEMSGQQINYEDEQAHRGSCRISGKPDKCPICGRGIEPVLQHAFKRGDVMEESVEVVFKCPSEKCRHLFIAYYYPVGSRINVENYFTLSHTRLPLAIEYKEFSEIIKKMSSQFHRTYNQAMLAEENGLDQICGAGYRRALEFLVKDYLIAQFQDEKEKIKSMWLKKAIDRIDNENIKTCAERAAWLGNDETHYVRIWEDKDIENLKDLISLVVSWIESEEKTKKYKEEMKKNI